MTLAAHRIFARIAGILVLLLIFSCLARAHAAFPSDLIMQSEEDDEDVTWQLTADQVTSLSDAEVLEARGNVVLRRGDDYLKADFARYYMTTKWVFLQGNVVARMGKDDLRAREMELDLRNRTGWLKDGEIFMDGPHIYFSGQRIDKHFGDVYSFKQAKVTACDGDTPAWSLSAGEAVVEIDGYAQLWHTSFQVMDNSVMYVPWMVIPAKRERQSGFLYPRFGHTNNQGVYIDIPYFWAIDESQDLLLNEYIMSERGLMQGAQYRARPGVEDAVWLRFDWLADSERVRHDSDDPVNDSDGLLRTNSQRYWLRGMFDLALPGDSRWKLRGDIDFVSDQNYLHEFKNNYLGFHANQRELFDTFHRELRERDLSRQTGIQLYRDWDRFSVALSGTYIQNPDLGHGNKSKSSDTTVQTLPALNAYLYQGSIIPGFPLEVAADGEAAYYYRESGTRGARYQMTPQLSLPVNGRFGSIIATAGVRQALYGTDTYDTKSGRPKESDESQTVPFYSVAASTELARVFPLDGPALTASADNIGKTSWTAVRHSVQPRVEYARTPRVDQEKTPWYTDEDRIAPVNELTYSITSVLTRKRDRVEAAKPAGDGEEPQGMVVTDYLDVLRVKVEQSYDLREADRTEQREAYRRRPYSDILLEAQLAWDEHISLRNKTYWSPYDNSVTRQESGLNIAWAPYGSVYAGFDYRDSLDEYARYRADKIKSLVFRSSITAFDPLTFNLTYRRDYERSKDVERSLDIIYTHQCFQLVGRLSSETGDVRYEFMVVLTGLGD